MIVPGPENVGVCVGILGQYVGMINLPADTSRFPDDLSYDLGHCLVVKNRKLVRVSFRQFLAALGSELMAILKAEEHEAKPVDNDTRRSDTSPPGDG